LKPERWGSPLVQEKYQEEKACDKRHPYRIIIIQKLQNIFKIKAIMQTANIAMEEILDGKDLNITELNHLI